MPNHACQGLQALCTAQVGRWLPCALRASLGCAVGNCPRSCTHCCIAQKRIRTYYLTKIIWLICTKLNFGWSLNAQGLQILSLIRVPSLIVCRILTQGSAALAFAGVSWFTWEGRKSKQWSLLVPARDGFCHWISAHVGGFKVQKEAMRMYHRSS